ncbi:ferritin-like domain-containing protein, partial [Escherichia coli]
MNMKTIEDVFIHLLSDTYSAEKQLTRALAKLARATSNEKLSQAFHAHLEETTVLVNGDIIERAGIRGNCSADIRVPGCQLPFRRQGKRRG